MSGRILKPGLGGVGYLTVVLYENNKRTTKNVHQLVAEAFLGNRPDGYTVNHIDGDKTNNDSSNLEFVTYAQNLMHAYDLGLNKHPQPVRIVETGEVFNSMRECASAIGGDTANISSCISGKLNSHKGLHFELAEKKQKPPFLYDYQREAVRNMKNGCILNGGVGSGKSRTGLYYYFSQHGGSMEPEYIPMKNPRDLYIITTARKRDTLEWEGELRHYLLSTDPELNGYNNKVVVDSWNNIKKYSNVDGSWFVFDEQRVVGSGTWVKSFLKIARRNKWILLSATAGDTWNDYIPVFVANGFYKNKTEFINEHVIYSRFTKYPKVDRYVNTGRLLRQRNDILIDMDFKRQTVAHHEDYYVQYDITQYRLLMKNRWNIYKDCPIINAAELCYLLRKVVNSDPSRQIKLLEILEDHPKAIIFYGFDYELEILKSLYYGDDVEVAEWNGHKHDAVPTGDKWVYLVQYTAGCEGWNCITTDTVIFFSQNYSYKVMQQASGRIDRLNTPYKHLYYYHLKSRSGIDLAISRALSNKKKFNENKFAKW